METSQVARAVAAATSVAADLGLRTDDVSVLQNSNKLALRLMPCAVFAGVAPAGHGVARFETGLALRLAQAGGPVAMPEPRAEPRGYERDGFEVSLWTYYEPVAPRIPARDYAQALARLHAAMRMIDIAVPHFTERVADAAGHVTGMSALRADDRELLAGRLRDLGRAVTARRAPEQLLHGEPHPGNVLSTRSGPLFVDLETCCRGPVEFDLAHVPVAVSDQYPDADQALLRDCRGLVLAVVAKHRCDPEDQFPGGRRALHDLLDALRSGPPWPALDVVMRPYT
jgi:aminoglycoside phosphotransferase (APT) family kinase protein